MGNDPWGPPQPPPPQWQQQPQQQQQQPLQQQQPGQPQNWPGQPQGQQQWPGPQQMPMGGAMGVANPNAPRSDKPVLALVFAILSFIACGCFSSIPAFFIARAELAAIERGESSSDGKGMAQAAFWVAAANMILYGLILAAYGVIVLVAIISNVK